VKFFAAGYEVRIGQWKEELLKNTAAYDALYAAGKIYNAGGGEEFLSEWFVKTWIKTAGKCLLLLQKVIAEI